VGSRVVAGVPDGDFCAPFEAGVAACDFGVAAGVAVCAGALTVAGGVAVCAGALTVAAGVGVACPFALPAGCAGVGLATGSPLCLACPFESVVAVPATLVAAAECPLGAEVTVGVAVGCGDAAPLRLGVAATAALLPLDAFGPLGAAALLPLPLPLPLPFEAALAAPLPLPFEAALAAPLPLPLPFEAALAALLPLPLLLPLLFEAAEPCEDVALSPLLLLLLPLALVCGAVLSCALESTCAAPVLALEAFTFAFESALAVGVFLFAEPSSPCAPAAFPFPPLLVPCAALVALPPGADPGCDVASASAPIFDCCCPRSSVLAGDDVGTAVAWPGVTGVADAG
jgi:hypothetical protein